MASNIKEGVQGYIEQEPEVNIWAENGSDEGFTIRNVIVCTVQLI